MPNLLDSYIYWYKLVSLTLVLHDSTMSNDVCICVRVPSSLSMLSVGPTGTGVWVLVPDVPCHWTRRSLQRQHSSFDDAIG